MKKQEKLKKIIREMINLIIKFLKPYRITDEILTIPRNIKWRGFKVGFMELGITIVSSLFAFMLKATNKLIEQRLILFGIILFMLYRGQRGIKEALRFLKNSESKKFELILEDEIVFRSSQIVGKTSNKVLKYDTSNKLYKVMSNEAVLNSIKNYLQNLWQQKIQHTFDVLEILSVIVMLVAAILTNTSIPQVVFIPLIIVFVFITFFSSASISLNREEFYKKHREYNNEQSLIINDLLRVPVIVRDDLDMRINKFQKTVTESNENVNRFHNKMSLSRLCVTLMELFIQYGIIILYLLGVEWDSISLATITEITATLIIIETALKQISRISTTLIKHCERLTILEKEKQDMSLILDVFHNESEKTSKPKVVDNINIEPFLIQYFEKSENDKPFTLISKKQIHINSGEVVVLNGPSGSGKSTFMKMLTGRIQLERSTEVPSTSRFLFYDEKLRFGSLSIFEELFCCSKNPDITKMQRILENLHLWDEIKSNCFDVWKWMREKQFEQSLSNGQKQRLIIAKMLYWLSNEIDVIVLDECTSILDEESESCPIDAERILEYIVRYSNSDKKRIIIISTHQDMERFKQKLANEYAFRNLQFTNAGECNLVREI